jgi:hypothetical protein
VSKTLTTTPHSSDTAFSTDEIRHPIQISVSPSPRAGLHDVRANLRLVFRILFNATYLIASTPIICSSLLLRPRSDGLVAIAQRGYGSISLIVRTGMMLLQLHDCGMCTARSPFLLCVMMRETAELRYLGKEYSTPNLGVPLCRIRPSPRHSDHRCSAKNIYSLLLLN